MSKLRVLIVGASIAGPTAAYWFAKAGAKVTVIERFPHLRVNGQNVDIRTVGVTVMRKMQGMEAAVRAKVLPLEGLSFVRSDGRPYGIIRSTGNPDQQSLVSEYEIFRGDLSQILYDMTKDNENIKYVFGEQVASLQQHGEGDGPVQVEFLNGNPTTEYDLVVACDGSTSRTRAIGFGGGVRDHVHPINHWFAYFTIPNDLVNKSRIGQAYSAVGGRWMALGYDPTGVNRVTFGLFHRRNDFDAMIPFREAQKEGDDALKAYVAEEFKGMGWKVGEVLKQMWDSKDFYASEIVQVRPPTLFKGRFVLVGDAGYAPGPTGGGTSLALAGAYVLAGEICKHKGDIKAGLEGYETQMRPIITELQKIPPLIPGILAPQTAWGLWLRNWTFAFITWSGVIGFVQKYFASAFGSNDEDKLQEYEWEN